MTPLHRWTRMTLLGVLAIATTVAARSATVVSISGSAELIYTDQHATMVPDAPATCCSWVRRAARTRAQTRPTSPTRRSSNVDHADLKQGSGLHWGYYAMSLEADTVVARWSGSVTTTMKRDQPQTNFQGSWEYVKGTGAYAAIRGKGTYDGHFLARDRYLVNWRGSYTK